MKTQLQLGQYSDKGVKEENQDTLGFFQPDDANSLLNKGIILAIADGVSGCDAGKEASECTIKSLVSDYYCTADSWTVQTSIQKVLIALNSWMYEQGRLVGQFRSMATTLSAVIIKSTTAHIFHIGDSRVYLLRDRRLQCLTKDHIWKNGNKSQLVRALGIDLNIDIDYRKLTLSAGDYLILTTDGLHEYLKHDFIIQTILETKDLNDATQILGEKALENGSTDNVSCQIVQFEKLPTPDNEEIYRQLTELPFPPELEPGMKIDGYRIVREIHSSRRVQIYLAIDQQSGQSVVLKTPSVNYQDDPVYLELFSHEEWVGKRLNSPYVLKLFNSQRPKNFLYVATEYIKGQTLRQWIDDNGQSDLNHVRTLLEQIAKGLHAMHRLEMVHQDLKPENILLDTDGGIKIIDFGSTKIGGVEEIASPLERLHIVGTKNYSAPEYFAGLKGNQSSDIFSVAVIVYEMLTGHLPYGEKYGEAKNPKLIYTQARNWNNDIPLWVDGALEKALCKEPERRYQDIHEFVYDLSHPNNQFLKDECSSFAERNPVIFWKSVSLFLFITQIMVFFMCNKNS